MSQNENSNMIIEELESEQQSGFQEIRKQAESQDFNDHSVVAEIQEEVEINNEESISFNINTLLQKDDNQVCNMDDNSLKSLMIERAKEKSTKISEGIIEQWINYFLKDRARKDLISEFEDEIITLDKICGTINYNIYKIDFLSEDGKKHKSKILFDLFILKTNKPFTFK